MGFSEILKFGDVLKGKNGTQVEAHKRQETKSADVKPTILALHEAAHVFMAFITGEADVQSANLIPHGPVEGTTWTTKFGPTIVAAGAAIGDHRGAGGDRSIAAFYRADWQAGVKRARSLIRGNMHVIRAIASALEAWRDLGGGDLRKVYEEAKYGAEVVLTLNGADGRTQEEIVRTEAGTAEVKIPTWMLILMAAAEEETRDEKKTGTVEELPSRRRKGLEVDVITEADLAEDLRRAA